MLMFGISSDQPKIVQWKSKTWLILKIQGEIRLAAGGKVRQETKPVSHAALATKQRWLPKLCSKVKPKH